MKAFMVIKDPEAVELLGDATRRRVIYLLRVRERTISQIAEELRITPQAIYRHIRKLLDAGMVEVTREQKIENFTEKYYRATAESFEYSYGEGRSQEYAEQRLTEALRSLPKLGINARIDPEKISEIVGVQKKLTAVGSNPELEDRSAKLEGIDHFGKEEICKITKLISMTDGEFDAWLRLNKKFRHLLRSMVSHSKASQRSR